MRIRRAVIANKPSNVGVNMSCGNFASLLHANRCVVRRITRVSKLDRLPTKSRLSFSRRQNFRRSKQAIPVCERDGTSNASTASSTHPETTSAGDVGRSVGGEVECIGTAMEVTCKVEWGEEGAGQEAAAAPGTGAQQGGIWSVRGPGEVLLLISPFFFWGTSMVAMKILGPHTSPLFVGAFRLLPAGLCLVGWAAATGRPQPQGLMAWLAIALFALCDGTCFQGFLAEGLQRTSAGLGSVIIDSQPLTVALLASLLFKERLTGWGYGGLVLGVVGLCLLEIPPELLPAGLGPLSGGVGEVLSSTGSVSGGDLWSSGEWWMLLAAQSMAVGTVLVPWVSSYCDPVMATGWHLLLGGLPLAGLAAVREGAVLADRLPLLTGLDVLLLLYTSLLGSAASYGVFFYNASRGNLTALSSLTFLTPMFAALGGFLVLGESFTPLQLTGAGVTLAAVTLVNLNHVPGGNKDKEG